MRLQQKLSSFRAWVHRHRRPIIRAVIGIGVLFIVVQVLYPNDRMVPNASVDGVKVGGLMKKDAAWELDSRVQQQPVNIYVGESSSAYDNPKPLQIGMTIHSEARLKDSDYPWYLRLVPTSLLWYGFFQSENPPTYETDESKAKQYLEKQLGASCNIPAKNATVQLKDKKLVAEPAKHGGTCNENDALQALTEARPQLGSSAKITIPVTVKKATIPTSDAEDLARRLTEKSKNGITLVVGKKKLHVSHNEVISWLSFNNEKMPLTYSVDAKKAATYLAKNATPLVAKLAGTTVISTRDFTVTAKKTGQTGRTLAVGKTLASVKSVLDGERMEAEASSTDLPPKVTYRRSYTKTSTGIAAMLKHYDDDHAGSFGVTFQELGGRGLSAQHNSTQRFTTASTYKLFVAYGTLRKVDAGTWKWSDANIANGRNLSTCFDDMIVKSDNACAEALLKKLGLSKLTNDLKTIGLNSSGFTLGDTPLTTARDLNIYLVKLQTNRLPIKSASRDRLVDAMKRNVYRQGIPTGASGQVADKVGFLNGLLHDAAIVYSPKGTYALTVLTDGSSWANIAELTRKIEALR